VKIRIVDISCPLYDVLVAAIPDMFLDSTRAVIPNAQVLIHNQATGVNTRTTITEDRLYTALPDTNDIKVTKDGFSTQQQFSVEQIVSVLKQAEVGVPIAELIRKVGISEQTFYRWKSKYVGLEVDQVRQLKQLRDENTRLKQLVAELSLDKTMLQDVIRKKF